MVGPPELRFTPDNGVPLTIDGCVGEVVVSVGPSVANVVLHVGDGVTSVQLVGVDRFESLHVQGRASSRLELVATTEKTIGVIEIIGLHLCLADIQCRRIRLGMHASAIGSADVASGVQLVSLESSQGLWLYQGGGDRSIIACGELREFDQSGWTATPSPLKAMSIVAPSVQVGPFQSLDVADWQAPAQGALIAGEGAVVRISGSSPANGFTFTGPKATLDVDGGAVRSVSGEIGTLRTTGSAIVAGKALWVHRLRCENGASIDGIELSQMDASSLDFAAKAATFGISPPRWTTSWDNFTKRRPAHPAWKDPATWRLLYTVLESRGSPRSAMWARTMERDVRRSLATWGSVERWVLEVARVLGYGERLLRPLWVHLLVTLSACSVVLWLTETVFLEWVTKLPYLFRLFFLSPLGLVNGSLFVPQAQDGSLIQAMWLVCALSGTTCFATAGLAVRRLLAYG